MDSDLVHSSSSWFAEHNAGFSIEAKLLECRDAVLSFWRDFAYADFVAYNFNWFSAFHYFTVNIKHILETQSNFYLLSFVLYLFILFSSPRKFKKM